MEKRGLEHIEAILSFVLFIGFIIFALYFFNPLRTDRIVDSSLYYAFDEISENSTIQTEKYSIVLLNSSLPKIIRLNLFTTLTSPNIGAVVQDRNGRTLNSSINKDGGRFDINVSLSGNDFIYVTFGENIKSVNPPGPGVLLNTGNYSLASSEVNQVLSEEKFIQLINNYNSDYSSLKKNFNLPNRIDFAFSVVFSQEDKLEAQINIPENLDVFSKTERREVIRNNGEIQFADIIVKVW